MRRKLTDPMRAVGKTVDQCQPGRLGQGPEDAGYIFVLVHLIIDRHITFISLTGDHNKAGMSHHLSGGVLDGSVICCSNRFFSCCRRRRRTSSAVRAAAQAMHRQVSAA